MFPPVEDSVLQSNPQFALLHAQLTTKILNTAGTTRQQTSKKEWSVTREELNKERQRAAKHHLLRNAMRNLDISTPTAKSSSNNNKPKASLPPELVEQILLLSSHLNTPRLEASSERLLESTEQWDSLPHNIPQIASLLSSHIQTRALLLARILSPTTNPSYLHRTIPKLCTTTTSTRHQINSKKEELAARRNALVTQTLQVLEQYQQATSLTISHLELTTHGALSRHLKAKSEYLALQALSMSLLVKEKETKARKMVYTEQVQEALTNYLQHLRIERERLSERGRDAERVLWSYGVGRDGGGEKEKVMKEVARMYGKLKSEMKGVQRDVARLRGK